MARFDVLTTFGIEDVRAAADRLRGFVHRTPVVRSRTLDDAAGGSVVLKCESFQRTGSFKFRGAMNTLLSLSNEERARGVCAVSSGNHAQALALAARERGVRAVVSMPADTPEAKIRATRGYGADIVAFDRYAAPQDAVAAKLREEGRMTFVSSHDDPRISAGAGTAALELVEDAGPIDVLVAPVGGGGGLAGYATVVKALCPGVRVVAVEAAASGLAARSMSTGERVRIPVPKTIADGQQLAILGEFPFEVMQRTVDEVVTVEEAEIVDAMRFLFDRMKLVSEPSGAIATAAVLNGKVRGARRIGVIVSGGNAGAERFASLVSSGA